MQKDPVEEIRERQVRKLVHTRHPRIISMSARYATAITNQTKKIQHLMEAKVCGVWHCLVRVHGADAQDWLFVTTLAV